MLNASFVISTTHPSLDGHFPEHPITPGVITLDHVVRGLVSQLPGTRLVGFPIVKFLQPIYPNTEIKVRYKIKHESLYHFSCESEGAIFVTGKIELFSEAA
jgi:3-hydroxymyristoyl/3-hydroxydecanoyl-(acyl carrier protein) dehydratase